jgi:hypothetical protein
VEVDPEDDQSVIVLVLHLVIADVFEILWYALVIDDVDDFLHDGGAVEPIVEPEFGVVLLLFEFALHPMQVLVSETLQILFFQTDSQRGEE